MQIPILSGVYASKDPDFRVAYPHNLVPVPVSQGISAGYLRPADGLKEFATGGGFDRGGIRWKDTLYRVQGTDLVSVSKFGSITVIGSVGPGGYCHFDYSFTHLAVASGGRLYLYDGSALTQVTDADLGTVLSFVWVDGYFMTTDGTNLVVTELGDPFSVNPLKYGSSEFDPDSVQCVVEFGGEVYAVNRHSIEAFDNIGGSGFPFQRIDGSETARGAIGSHAASKFDDKMAFVGGGLDEGISVYQYANGATARIATREIDLVLAGYTEAQLADVVLEQRSHLGHEWLYVHLPDQSLVYDVAATRTMQEPVWFTLSGGTDGRTKYPARGFVNVYDKWLAGNPDGSQVVEIDRSTSTHFGSNVAWEFDTQMIYNEGRGAIVHELELVCQTGSIATGDNPVVSTSYSADGMSYSQERTRPAGKAGESIRRLRWLRAGMMDQRRTQRFRGDSSAHISITRLEAQIEGLAN